MFPTACIIFCSLFAATFAAKVYYMRFLLVACLLFTGFCGFGQGKLQTGKRQEDPNGIDPGIVRKKDSVPPTPQVFSFVEQMPKPSVDIIDYLSKNIKYPQEAQKKGIEGRVFVRFVVNEDGSLSDFTVLRGIGGGCDEEAVRVLKSMPPWIPGKQNGKKIKVYYSQPITFKLM